MSVFQESVDTESMLVGVRRFLAYALIIGLMNVKARGTVVFARIIDLCEKACGAADSGVESLRFQVSIVRR